MEPEIKLLIAIGSVIAAWWANKKTKELTGKSLWEHLNCNIRSFCDKINKWLKDNHSFGAEIVRFSVCELDNLRKNLYRLTAEGINKKGEVKIISITNMTEEECKKRCGIAPGQHKDVNVADILQQLG